MKKIAFVLAGVVIACAASTRTSAAPRPLVCTAGHARVELDTKAWAATYYDSGKLVGSSPCAGTRRAVFNMDCSENPAFRFQFAGVPGPAALGGKSAQLDASGKSALLDCR